MKKYGPVIVKKITINKIYGTLRDERAMQLNIRPGSEQKNNTFIKQIFRSGWMGLSLLSKYISSVKNIALYAVTNT